MQPSLMFLAASTALFAGAAVAEPRIYHAERADQFLEALFEDSVPADPEARQAWARHAAYDAAVFGRAPVLIYTQMYNQAIDRASDQFVGFNAFAHGRDLAGPGYKPFKSPNADTLYSNAYLDLTAGPLLLTVPDTGGRYYTLNFLDLFGNATNIGARTHGTGGGKFLIATTDWGGAVPEGVTLFRVTQPYMWILMRMEAEGPQVLPEARALQDRFVIESTAKAAAARPFPQPAELDDPSSSLTVLDWVVEEAGIRETEAALVRRFRPLGVGGPVSVEAALADPVVAAGAREGLADADNVIARSIGQDGAAADGWSKPNDIGRYGYNYLHRAVIHTLGTGANVRLENYPFTTFRDAKGEPLDGSQHSYVHHLDTPPPADFFWSVTVYDRQTQELWPNPQSKYRVGEKTLAGLVMGEDGSVAITLSRDASGTNALPIHGPFYLALRAQGPRRPLLLGEWRPAPVRKQDERE